MESCLSKVTFFQGRVMVAIAMAKCRPAALRFLHRVEICGQHPFQSPQSRHLQGPGRWLTSVT